MAMVFALASMMCAALSDVIFKLYARSGRSTGLYVACIGGVWLVVFGALACFQQTGPVGGASMVWGGLSGLFGVAANLLFIEAMKRRDVVTCATIYRLNLAPAALLALIMLGEQLAWAKSAGILTAVLAVLLLWQDGVRGHAHLSLQIWPVVLASILRALMGLAYKVGLSQEGSALAMLSLNGFMWVVGGLAYVAAVTPRQRRLSHELGGFPLAMVSGILCTGIVGFLMLGLQRGEASIVLPTSQLSFVLTALIGVVVLKEAASWRRVGSIAMGCVCVILMAKASHSQSVQAAEPPATSPATTQQAPPDPLAPIEDDPALPRVLLIGDSISMGYTIPTRSRLAGIANVHRPPVNCRDTAEGIKCHDEWLGERKWDVIHFNFGLHDLKFRDGSVSSDPAIAQPVASVEDYEKNLRVLVARLQKTGAKLIWATTTPVPEGAGGRAPHSEVRYNDVAAKVMAENSVTINDLCKAVNESPSPVQRPRNVHFTPEGYEYLSTFVVQSIRTALEQ